MTLDFVLIYFKWWDHIKLCSECKSFSTYGTPSIFTSNEYQDLRQNGPVCSLGKKILTQYWYSFK